MAVVAALSNASQAQGCSADFQSAVSRIVFGRASAIPNASRSATLRYSRMQFCGTQRRLTGTQAFCVPNTTALHAEHNWSVTRRSFAGRQSFLQIQRVGRSQRAAAHRAALRKSSRPTFGVRREAREAKRHAALDYAIVTRLSGGLRFHISAPLSHVRGARL